MPVIKLRGLPWSCTPEDIERFLGESIHVVKLKTEDSGSSEESTENNNYSSICLTTNAEGRPSGEAFVELVDESDVDAALGKNNAMMGQRYIEVFRSSIEQMRRFTAESNESASQWREPVVRLRGLPYGCTKKDVHEFFTGKFLSWLPVYTIEIHLVYWLNPLCELPVLEKLTRLVYLLLTKSPRVCAWNQINK